MRATFDAFNRGDFDTAMAFMHPDVEFRRVGAQPPLRGLEQVRAWMEPSAFERQVVEPIEMTVAGSKQEEDEARRAAAVADPGSSG